MIDDLRKPFTQLNVTITDDRIQIALVSLDLIADTKAAEEIRTAFKEVDPLPAMAAEIGKATIPIADQEVIVLGGENQDTRSSLEEILQSLRRKLADGEGFEPPHH